EGGRAVNLQINETVDGGGHDIIRCPARQSTDVEGSGVAGVGQSGRRGERHCCQGASVGKHLNAVAACHGQVRLAVAGDFADGQGGRSRQTVTIDGERVGREGSVTLALKHVGGVIGRILHAVGHDQVNLVICIQVLRYDCERVVVRRCGRQILRIVSGGQVYRRVESKAARRLQEDAPAAVIAGNRVVRI